MEMKQKSAGAVICRRENSKILYLLLKYSKEHWGFVKGHIERDEKEKEAIIREAKEETNLDDLTFIKGFKEKIDYYFNEEGEKIYKEVIFYLAMTDEKDIKISYEHIGFKWLEYNDALGLLSYKNTKEVLRKANELLISDF